MVPVKSHKAQLEAMHSSKQSDFERDVEGKQTRRKNKHARKCFRRKEGACSSNDLERSVASSMLEQWFRALSGLERKRSMLEHWFRALSGVRACSNSAFERSVAAQTPQKASSSSDFERPVATVQARAVISRAQWLRSTLEQWFRAQYSKKQSLCRVFERCRGNKSFKSFKANRWFERQT